MEENEEEEGQEEAEGGLRGDKEERYLASEQAWGDRYFEHQQTGLCGQHAGPQRGEVVPARQASTLLGIHATEAILHSHVFRAEGGLLINQL